METRLLEKLGLEQKEANIYLGLLKLGKASATKISDETRIERTLCYSIIQKLIDKGLVSYIIEQNIKYFSAAPPDKLMIDLKEKQQELQKALPSLKELMAMKKTKSKAEIFQGKEGVKTVLKDIIKDGKNYLVFGEEGRFQEVLPIESEQFMRKIEQAKIKERVLVKKGQKVVKSKNSSFKFIDAKYLSPTSTLIYGDKTAIFVWSDPMIVILIENKEVSQSYKTYFEILWKLS